MIREFHARSPAEKKDLAEYLDEHAPMVLEDLTWLAEVFGKFDEIHLLLDEDQLNGDPDGS